MVYKKYQSLKRIGTQETNGLTYGKCHIFPKLDGTNGVVWLQDGEVKAGSRNKELGLGKQDNYGFYGHMLQSEPIKAFLTTNPNLILYGEFLVKHTISSYNENAWRNFYVFDVGYANDDEVDNLFEENPIKLLPYGQYKPMLDEYGVDYIPVQAIIDNPSEAQLAREMENNTYLMSDGIGEGIVVKNYDFTNRFGNAVWAKMIHSEFAEKASRKVKVIDMRDVEQRIVDDYLTTAFIEKTQAKVQDGQPWENRMFGALISRCFNELLNEEITEIVRTMKRPTINFGKLQGMVTEKVKVVVGIERCS